MKLNKNGKPRKTFALAISIAKEQKEKLYTDIFYWSDSELELRAEKDNPKYAEHYESIVTNLEEAWIKWHGATRVVRALEAVEND